MMRASQFTKYEKEFPNAILKDPAYSFDLIFSRNEFIGLALFWTKDRFIYIEHLCILPEKRNMHYGEMTLDFLKQYGKILILEIDPPYHKEFKGHELRIMSYLEPISNDVYREFNDYLGSHIMADAF